jgi:hypothetical protein
MIYITTKWHHRDKEQNHHGNGAHYVSSQTFANEYWGEAVATTVSILNKCSTKSVKNRVPQESWTRLKHSMAHLKVFGYVAYAHVPYDLRNKLDNKGPKCIFFGYLKDTKGYKLYDPVARKVIISHDVQFVENEAWNGGITRIVKIIDAMEHDDIEDEMVQTPCKCQCTVPSTPITMEQITTQNNPIRTSGA